MLYLLNNNFSIQVDPSAYNCSIQISYNCWSLYKLHLVGLRNYCNHNWKFIGSMIFRAKNQHKLDNMHPWDNTHSRIHLVRNAPCSIRISFCSNRNPYRLIRTCTTICSYKTYNLHVQIHSYYRAYTFCIYSNIHLIFCKTDSLLPQIQCCSTLLMHNNQRKNLVHTLLHRILRTRKAITRSIIHTNDLGNSTCNILLQSNIYNRWNPIFHDHNRSFHSDTQILHSRGLEVPRSNILHNKALLDNNHKSTFFLDFLLPVHSMCRKILQRTNEIDPFRRASNTPLSSKNRT